MTKVEGLHRELLARQNGMTDGDFVALWPHISRQYYQKLRTGDRPITLAICAQIRVVWPELTDLTIAAEREIIYQGAENVEGAK